MTCPQCGISLHDSSLLDFAVSRCSGCGGIWVSPGVLQQFLNMKRSSRTPRIRSRNTHSDKWRPDERHQVIRSEGRHSIQLTSHRHETKLVKQRSVSVIYWTIEPEGVESLRPILDSVVKNPAIQITEDEDVTTTRISGQTAVSLN
jgi:Zn-finger nucleic acid-binding protein